MKKILYAVLATTFVAGLAGCSSNSEAGGQPQSPAVGETYSIEVGSTNPLSQKQYKVLEIDGNNDFLEFFNLLNGEYSGLIIEFSNYMETHTSDIEIDNKGFADFDDYESTFDHYYQFLYGVLHCDSKSIPNEYNDAWSCYKTTIAQNKEDLDGLYLLRGQELIDGADEMLTHIQVGAELVAEALPDNDSYSDLEIVAAEFCKA
jgi:hypothetical protein